MAPRFTPKICNTVCEIQFAIALRAVEDGDLVRMPEAFILQEEQTHFLSRDCYRIYSAALITAATDYIFGANSYIHKST